MIARKRVDPKKKKIAKAVNDKFNQAQARGSATAQSKIENERRREDAIKIAASKVKSSTGPINKKEQEQYRAKASTGSGSSNMSSNAGANSQQLKIREMARVYDPQLSGANQGNRKRAIRKSSASKEVKRYYRKKIK